MKPGTIRTLLLLKNKLRLALARFSNRNSWGLSIA